MKFVFLYILERLHHLNHTPYDFIVLLIVVCVIVFSNF
uniref:Uncharacterized protein n=1 Tax=Arundo donax TaxID=35708 RepID=A0A0A9EJT1_ARUDO